MRAQERALNVPRLIARGISMACIESLDVLLGEFLSPTLAVKCNMKGAVQRRKYGKDEEQLLASREQTASGRESADERGDREARVRNLFGKSRWPRERT
jgi:hypothetical protein